MIDHRIHLNYRHLSWATPQQNCLDQRRDGTAQLGERNWQAKLTAEQITEIRNRYARGERQRALASEYGVAVMTVNRACRGETWSHVA